MWENVFNSDVKNIERIFPLQQKAVTQFVNEVSKREEVKKIIIFGSSIEPRCNPWSDIDIYVELSKQIPINNSVYSKPLDIWTNFDVDESEDLYKDIQEGVVVYER